MSADAAPRTRRALGSTFGASLVTQLINTATGVILARSLGVTDRGELAAALLWPRVLGILSTFGLEESATYHVAREPRRAGTVLGSGLVLWARQSLAFAVLCAVLVPLALGHHGHATVISGLIFVSFIPLNGLGILLNGVLLGQERYAAYNRVRLGAAVLLLAIQVGLVAIDAMTVRRMVWGYVVAYALTALILVGLVRRVRPRRDPATVRSLFGYGIRSHASTMSSQLNQRLDLLVISAFLSARQLGLYVIAVAFTSMTGLVGLSVARVALPSVARIAESDERTALARRLVSLTLLASVAVAVPVVVFAPQLVDLFFGSAYRPATDVTRVLVVATIAFSLSRAIEAVLRAVGRPLDAGIAEIVALGATFVGLAVLVPVLGIVGAGLASLLAYAVACVWMTRRAARALELRWPLLFIPAARTR